VPTRNSAKVVVNEVEKIVWAFGVKQDRDDSLSFFASDAVKYGLSELSTPVLRFAIHWFTFLDRSGVPPTRRVLVPAFRRCRGSRGCTWTSVVEVFGALQEIVVVGLHVFDCLLQFPDTSFGGFRSASLSPCNLAQGF